MKISENFEKKQIKSFSLNFDKKLIRHIQKLKSPDKRIKKAMIYFAKTGGKRIRPFLLCRMGLYLNIKPKILKQEKKDDTNTNTNSLRISKSNEQKPEIKKVKKQDTEKKEYKIKDYVVYPKHGVGQISEFKKMNIGGIDIEAYILKFEKDFKNNLETSHEEWNQILDIADNNYLKCMGIPQY